MTLRLSLANAKMNTKKKIQYPWYKLERIWDDIKEIINSKQKFLFSQSCVKDGDKILTDQKEIANNSITIFLKLQKIY